MNTQYYIRFTLNPEKDLERNYSFTSYILEASAEKYASEWGVDIEDVKQDNVTGLWGYALPGLCGFGPFTTLEEAQEELACNRGTYEQYDGENAVIFEGVRGGSTQDDGSLFYATRIVYQEQAQ